MPHSRRNDLSIYTSNTVCTVLHTGTRFICFFVTFIHQLTVLRRREMGDTLQRVSKFPVKLLESLLLSFIIKLAV